MAGACSNGKVPLFSEALNAMPRPALVGMSAISGRRGQPGTTTAPLLGTGRSGHTVVDREGRVQARQLDDLAGL